MASNIQLENLLAVVTEIKEKKIFLYVNNPAEEPTYITIVELFNNIDTEFDLKNSLNRLTQALERIQIHDDKIASLETGIQGLIDRLNNLDTNYDTLKGDVEYCKEQIETLLTTVNQHTSQISSLQDQMNDAKEELTNMQGSIDDIKGKIDATGNESRDYFDMLAWKKL